MEINYKEHLDQAFREITSLGGFIFSAFIIIVALTLREYQLALKLIFGLFFSLLVVVLIRTFYYKERPQKRNHTNYIEKLTASAFPSLHTGRIIFLSITLSVFFNNLFSTIFFTGLALLVMYSRIYRKKHDVWDLLGGVVLGLITYGLSIFV